MKPASTPSPKLSYSQRRFESSRATVDLGSEPPIELGGPRRESAENRKTPLRWIAGSTLTGLSGLALIGSTLWLDLNQQAIFASAPEFAAPPRREANEASSVSEGKGDRLVRPVDIVAAKQTFKSPTTIKVGDKEVVKRGLSPSSSTTLTLTPTRFRRRGARVRSAEAHDAGPKRRMPPLDPGPPCRTTPKSPSRSHDLTRTTTPRR